MESREKLKKKNEDFQEQYARYYGKLIYEPESQLIVLFLIFFLQNEEKLLYFLKNFQGT